MALIDVKNSFSRSPSLAFLVDFLQILHESWYWERVFWIADG